MLTSAQFLFWFCGPKNKLAMCCVIQHTFAVNAKQQIRNSFYHCIHGWALNHNAVQRHSQPGLLFACTTIGSEWPDVRRCQTENHVLQSQTLDPGLKIKTFLTSSAVSFSFDCCLVWIRALTVCVYVSGCKFGNSTDNHGCVNLLTRVWFKLLRSAVHSRWWLECVLVCSSICHSDSSSTVENWRVTSVILELAGKGWDGSRWCLLKTH